MHFPVSATNVNDWHRSHPDTSVARTSGFRYPIQACWQAFALEKDPTSFTVLLYAGGFGQLHDASTAVCGGIFAVAFDSATVGTAEAVGDSMTPTTMTNAHHILVEERCNGAIPTLWCYGEVRVETPLLVYTRGCSVCEYTPNRSWQSQNLLSVQYDSYCTLHIFF